MEKLSGRARLLLRFFRWFANPFLRDHIEGDLLEQYFRLQSRKGTARADGKLLAEISTLLRPAIIRRAHVNSLFHYNSKAMIKNYFLISWRSIMRRRSTTAINVFGLSLGIAACIIIFLLTSFELSFDKFHPDRNRIYRVAGQLESREGASFKTGCVPLPTAHQLRSELTGFETVAGFFVYDAKVTINEAEKKVKRFAQVKSEIDNNIILAEPEYFGIFKYEWLAGSPALSLLEPFKVVLSESEARRYFGSGSPQDFIGRQVVYNDSLVVTVSGIVKDWKANSDFDFKDFISWSTIENSFLKEFITLHGWSNWDINNQVFVKLSSGNAPGKLEQQLQSFAKAHLKPDVVKPKALLQPLGDIHFNTDIGDEYSKKASLPILYGLIGIAVFILLIAAVNFINLSTAQSMERSKEIGIRKVMGSSKQTLAIRFLSETFLVTVLAVILALLMIKPLLNLLAAYMPQGLKFTIWSSGLWLFVAAITIVTSLIAGFYPAKVLSAFQPVQVLKGQKGSSGTGHGWLRKSLIVFQFTVSLLFILGTIVVGDQIHYLLSKDLGVDKDAIITIRTNRNAPEGKRDYLAARIEKLHGVAVVSISSKPATAEGQNGTIMVYKGTQNAEVEISSIMADDKFLSLYAIRLIAGRNYDRSDTIRQLLINQTAAAKLGFKNPADAVGKSVFIGMSDRPGSNQVFPIVGVLADFHAVSLHRPIAPLFMASSSAFSHQLNVKLSSAENPALIKNTIAAIADIWKEVYPEEPFEYSFFDETIASFYKQEQKTAVIINMSMTVAIFISCMGLFGLIAFVTAQRKKEVGIRKVLGASVRGIIFLLCRDFIYLVLVAILVASPIAWYLTHHWLQDFPYHISVQPGIFLLAGLFAIGIAILTISVQAIKAAIANPAKSLRSE